MPALPTRRVSLASSVVFHFVGAALLIACGALVGETAQAQTPTVIDAVRVNTSEPLRTMPPVPARFRTTGPFIIPNRFPHRFDQQPIPPMRPGLVDPVLDNAPVAARGGQPSTVLLGFNGVAASDGLAFSPPDPTGEIGPTHFVQMTNGNSAIYTRAGVLAMGPFPSNQFWQGAGGLCESENDGDPIVLYDETAGRWLVSQFVSVTGPDALCVAISTTGDPTGAYHQYEFPWPEGFPDYPKYGVWPTGYTLATSTFPDAGSNFSQAVMLERDAMLTGAPARSIRFNFPATEYYSMLPVDFDGPPPPTGTPGLFAGLRLSSDTPSEREVIRLYALTPDWATPANSTFSNIGNLPVAPFDVYALFSRSTAIPQLGTTDRIAGLGHRPMQRLQYRNRGTHGTLLFNHTIAVNDGPTTRTGVRWYELRDGGTGTWSLYQQGTFAPADGLFRWIGSMAMNDAGDIGLGYSVSSSGMHPAIRFAGQSAGASGTGRLDVPEIEVYAGTGSQTGSGNRWGDYTHLSIDPTDGSTFWYTNMYYATTSSFNFKTRNAHLQLGQGQAPPAASIAPGALSVALAAGGTTAEAVTVSNTAAPGAQSLVVTASIQNLSAAGEAPAPSVARPAGPTPSRALASSAASPPGRDKDAPGAGPDPDGVRGTGGPDTFGNVWTDSNEPGGPTFAWVDIAATGTPVTLGDDNASGAITLPFAFPFYGVDQTQVYIGSNGYLTFQTGGNTGTASRTNQNLPSATDPDDLIALYWDDLNPALAGTVHYQDMGDGRFIVQFTGVPHYNVPSEASTFQAILYASGQIDLQYLTMADDASEPTSHTVGIENAGGSDGLTVVYNAAYVQNNLLVRFTQPPVWASVAPASRTVAPGGSDTFTVTFDATGLTEGTYTGDLVLTSNDPDTPTTTIPLTLTVTGSNVVAGTAGWRLLAPSAQGMTVDDFAAMNLVQGVPGYYPTAGTNILTDYDGTVFSSGGAGTPLAPGTGFFWYFYDQTLTPGGPSNSVELPMALTTTLPVVTTDTDVTLHPSFNMLGNPFGVSLDVSGVGAWPGASALASTVVQMWNASGGTYEPSVTRSTISPWQGFWAEGATAGTLTIPTSAQTTGGVLQRGGDRALVAFQLAAADGARVDRAAVLTMGTDADAGADLGDAAKLSPVAAEHVLLAFTDGSETMRAVENRPIEAVTLPMAVASVGAGADLVLTWPRVEGLPEGWALTLRDLATGATTDLAEASRYAFSVVPTAARVSDAPPTAARAEVLPARFTLTVGPRGTVGTGGEAAPVLALDAPRPNPARSSVTLGYTLPTTGAARLSVVDLLGREVAVLLDAERPAGSAAVTLDASALAPGVYVVRLVTVEQTLTQRLVVVR